MPEARVTWDETWMGVADAVAKRSRCDGAHVGAVLVNSDQRPVATGYNGPPAGFPDESGLTCSSWCPRQKARSSQPATIKRMVGRQVVEQPNPFLSYGLSCPSVHAEANALMFADRRDYAYGTVYVTAAVCADCAKLLANSGVARVVMRVREEDAHRDPEASARFMRECGLRVDLV